MFYKQSLITYKYKIKMLYFKLWENNNIILIII